MTYPDFDMNTLGESCSRQSEYRTGAENRQTVPHASSGGTRNWAHWVASILIGVKQTSTMPPRSPTIRLRSVDGVDRMSHCGRR